LTVAGRARGVFGAIAEWFASPRVRIVLAVIAWGYLALRWYLLLTSDDPILAADARTYWGAPYDDPYTGPQLGLPGAYLYPPPFLQALAPLRLLPWEAFHAIWAALGFGALIYLVRPIGAALVVTLLPFVFRDLLVGNIHLMLAAALVLSFRWPAIWAFPILTKLTPGIGVLWYAVRREWRRLAIALATAGGIALLSFGLTPDLWMQWATRMREDSGTAGSAYLSIFVVRLVVAGALVAYAARSGRMSLVPIAVLVALPILWPDSLALLLASFPLLIAERRERLRSASLTRA
jgi:hypothetical protein